MTLRQVADGTGFPLPTLIARLGLPPDIQPDTPLDQLAAEHGLRLRDIRQDGNPLQSLTSTQGASA
jgi:hypothetical protein